MVELASAKEACAGPSAVAPLLRASATLDLPALLFQNAARKNGGPHEREPGGALRKGKGRQHVMLSVGILLALVLVDPAAQQTHLQLQDEPGLLEPSTVPRAAYDAFVRSARPALDAAAGPTTAALAPADVAAPVSTQPADFSSAIPEEERLRISEEERSAQALWAAEAVSPPLDLGREAARRSGEAAGASGDLALGSAADSSFGPTAAAEAPAPAQQQPPSFVGAAAEAGAEGPAAAMQAQADAAVNFGGEGGEEQGGVDEAGAGEGGGGPADEAPAPPAEEGADDAGGRSRPADFELPTGEGQEPGSDPEPDRQAGQETEPDPEEVQDAPIGSGAAEAAAQQRAAAFGFGGAERAAQLGWRDEAQRAESEVLGVADDEAEWTGAAAGEQAPMLPMQAAALAAGEDGAGADAAPAPGGTARRPAWPLALLGALVLGCALRSSGACGLCRALCADLCDAALDSRDTSREEGDEGSLLPLVHPSAPRSRRPPRSWRLLHALAVRIKAFARARGGRLSDGAAGGRGADGGGTELAPRRRQAPARSLEPPLDSRALATPALSRLVSEMWVPRLLGSRSDPPSLVGGDALRALCKAVLPRRYAIMDWVLHYSTEQHGCSLHTAYARAGGEGHEPCVLLLLDSAGHTFGAYCSVPPRAEGHYRGTGECCLFSVQPRFAVYRWSRKNELFVLGGHDFLGFGSGPAFGLRVDDSFEWGCSGRSDTFDNECLASAAEFRIVKAEIWGFA